MIIFHSNNTFLDLREEDNLSIVDKTASLPMCLSFILRFHAIQLFMEYKFQLNVSAWLVAG